MGWASAGRRSSYAQAAADNTEAAPRRWILFAKSRNRICPRATATGGRCVPYRRRCRVVRIVQRVTSPAHQSECNNNTRCFFFLLTNFYFILFFFPAPRFPRPFSLWTTHTRGRIRSQNAAGGVWRLSAVTVAALRPSLRNVNPCLPAFFPRARVDGKNVTISPSGDFHCFRVTKITHAATYAPDYGRRVPDVKQI